MLFWFWVGLGVVLGMFGLGVVGVGFCALGLVWDFMRGKGGMWFVSFGLFGVGFGVVFFGWLGMDLWVGVLCLVIGSGLAVSCYLWFGFCGFVWVGWFVLVLILVVWFVVLFVMDCVFCGFGVVMVCCVFRFL